MTKEKTNFLVGEKLKADTRHHSETIKFSDHKIKFMCDRCVDKEVLDLGCVMHDPLNYKSKYWLHKALSLRSKSILGVDLYEPGVTFLNGLGYNIIVGNVESLNLRREFDVIVAGDIIEHINNFEGFFESCKPHLRKNGKLLISTPNPWYWRYVIRAIFGHEIDIVNPEHTVWFCPKTLKQIAERFGFSVIHFEYGARFNRELIMPLPKGLKNPSIFYELELRN